MGMHYRYQLVVYAENRHEDERAAMTAAARIHQIDKGARFFIDGNGEASRGEEGEWDFIQTLACVSTEFPDYRIVIYEDDDCANEHKVYHFVNGLYYWDDGEISYPEFNPNRLEAP